MSLGNLEAHPLRTAQMAGTSATLSRGQWAAQSSVPGLVSPGHAGHVLAAAEQTV